MLANFAFVQAGAHDALTFTPFSTGTTEKYVNSCVVSDGPTKLLQDNASGMLTDKPRNHHLTHGHQLHAKLRFVIPSSEYVYIVTVFLQTLWIACLLSIVFSLYSLLPCVPTAFRRVDRVPQYGYQHERFLNDCYGCFSATEQPVSGPKTCKFIKCPCCSL